MHTFTIKPDVWAQLRPEYKRMFPEKTASFEYLFSTNTMKAEKGLDVGVLNAVMFLAPAMTLSSLWNMCGSETKECFKACIAKTGRNRMPPAVKARAARTLLYKCDPARFFEIAITELGKLQKKARKLGLQLGVRPNGASDIAWENQYDFGVGTNWLRLWMLALPDARFYDYTKHFGRCMAKYREHHGITDYSLTFSWSGDNVKLCERIDPLVNIAVPFSTEEFPAEFLGRPVISGDDHDMRYLDPLGVIVGLKYKKAMKKGGGRMHKAAEMPSFIVQIGA